MEKHTLRFDIWDNDEMINPGATRVFLITKNNLLVNIGEVDESDIENSNLLFHFQIDIRKSQFENYEDAAVTIGHEVFVHAEKYADAISLLMKQVERKNLSNKSVARRLRRINKDRGGHGGINDHTVYSLGENEAVEQYFEQLIYGRLNQTVLYKKR